ncbi:MAG: sensor histidine kinase [Candidatus Poribacteria bacterium]|nr:sensor histidine kinase [Candidatus Poribacteria bacterium]
MAKFTVDTHLFRELGELLVGRDSTALIELIKNAYDADATEVTVYGERLDNPDEGHILVIDDGVGMNAEAFEKGFLRVASRLKEQGERRSPLFQRRYTGAKGIGRLAAHKLARKLEIDSVPQFPGSDGIREALNATIDWNKIEQYETLDDLDADAIRLETKPMRENTLSGTTLLLSQLRKAWTETERTRFFAEVQSFGPPLFLREPLPRSIIEKPLLFDTPVVRDQGSDAVVSPFQVNLEGDFAAGEDYWALVAEVATWVLEIQAVPGSDEVVFAVAPTRKTREDNPEARGFKQSLPHPIPGKGPYFEARILVREGYRGRQDQRIWATRVSGIRVYMEGFRVLPYGEQEDDWLALNADYARRPRQLEMLEKIRLSVEATDPDEGLTRLSNNNYFGAIFLTQEHCPSLRVLVNREGFIPEAGFDTLVQLVRTGIDLCTRARAAEAYERRQKRREDRRQESRAVMDQTDGIEADDTTDDSPETHELPNRLQDVTQLLKEAREHLNEGDTKKAKVAVSAAMQKHGGTPELTADLWAERSLLHVLASVGTQMAAFVHELNALLGAAQTIEYALEHLLKAGGLSREQRRRLRLILTVTIDLKRGLERQAAYLIDIETPDARRRRSRQYLCERFDAAVRLVQHQAERRGIKIDNRIPSELRSSPMFPAEITAIFANLLTNAVKAAGEDGHILASASSADEQIRILIQNTGTAVQLDEAERWFKPFQSTTSEVNPVLGQGMGLGLTITRNLLENYGAVVKFVPPDSPFKTAIEIALPSRS